MPGTIKLLKGHQVNIVSYGNKQSENCYLLIHGIGMALDYFEPLIERLAKGSYVMALDLPGFGGSSRPKQALSISRQADVVKAFIDYHNLHDVTLVGQSMGCQIIAELLVKYPKAAKKAVLVGPTVNCRERNLIMQTFRLAQDSFRETLKANRYVVRDYLRSAKYHAATIPYMLADKPEEKLIGINVPILIIRGSRDLIAPHYWVEELAAKSSNIEKSEVSGAPHLAQVTHPDEVAQLIIGFTKRDC